MILTEKARALILAAEGVDQPRHWPGGDSGITVGFGYDLGYSTFTRFRDDWRDELSRDAFDRLAAVIGLVGERARAVASRFSDVAISKESALRVFEQRTVPRVFYQCLVAFPGFGSLPADAQGALLSLVYNRGPRLKDSARNPGDRREMRDIRMHVIEYATADSRRRDELLIDIARQIRSMKRLWEGQNLDGLIRRREDEATLVESCITVAT